MKRLQCFFTAHEWLLQDEEYLVSLTNHLKSKSRTDIYLYYYQCQRCGKIDRIQVKHLEPKSIKELKHARHNR